MFVVLFMVPDLAFFGYLKSRRVGIYCYNVAHTYLSPAVLFAALTFAGLELADELALIWVTHIAADRLLGYGLKLQTMDRQTHLSG